MSYTFFLYKVEMNKGSLLLKVIKRENDYNKGLGKAFKVIGKKEFYYIKVQADNK